MARSGSHLENLNCIVKIVNEIVVFCMITWVCTYICTVCIIQCCGILSPGFLNTCIHNTYNIIVYVSLTGTSIGVRPVSYLNREFLLAFSVVLQANSDSSLVFKYLHFSRLEVDLERCTCT